MLPPPSLFNRPSREYLEQTIAKCRAAIAFASPNADMSYARAMLAAAEDKLAALESRA